MLVDRGVELNLIQDPAPMYEVFEIADMNIDEDRIAPFIMETVGTIIMNILGIIF